MLPISQYSALFSLLSTTYGGNGTTTFALPDLRSRVPLNYGQGQGLSNYALGQTSGVETTTLTTAQLPAHTHSFASNEATLNALTAKGTSQTPAAGSLLAKAVDGTAAGAQPLIYVPAGTPGTPVPLAGVNIAGTIAPTGQSGPVSLLQPYLALNFSIALQGIYPARN